MSAGSAIALAASAKIAKPRVASSSTTDGRPANATVCPAACAAAASGTSGSAWPPPPANVNSMRRPTGRGYGMRERRHARGPRGVEVGARREAAGELEVRHAVRERPRGARPVLVAAERRDERGAGAAVRGVDLRRLRQRHSVIRR